MSALLRKFWLTAIAVSFMLAPWVVLAAYNIKQNDDGTTGLENGLNSVQAIRFGRLNQVFQGPSELAPTWAVDEKEDTLFFTELGTASSALFVIPTTGMITRVDVAWGTTLSSANAVMAMYYWVKGTTDIIDTSGLVAAFALTLPTTTTGGGALSDDTIFKAVNLGDIIAVDTDGGPSNVVAGFVTIHIRPA